jgi:hypothetical protein
MKRANRVSSAHDYTVVNKTPRLVGVHRPSHPAHLEVWYYRDLMPFKEIQMVIITGW